MCVNTREFEISLDKILADAQEGLICDLRNRVAHTVTEIELRRMTAPSETEPCLDGCGVMGLPKGYDGDTSLIEKAGQQSPGIDVETG